MLTDDLGPPLPHRSSRIITGLRIAFWDCHDKVPQTGPLKTTLFSQGSGGWKSDLSVSRARSLCQLQGRVRSCFFQCLVAPGVPCVAASLQSLSTFTWLSSLCVCVSSHRGLPVYVFLAQIPRFLQGLKPYGIGAHLNDLILT